MMHITIFEERKQINEFQQEYWTARTLAKILEYSEYRHFKPVIEKAKTVCRASGFVVEEHFEDILEMVTIGSGAIREIDDMKLSRYACYLIVQSADVSKEIVALGQTYFAIQTRRQELHDQEQSDERRVLLRSEMKYHNKTLASTAKEAGVKNHAKFTDAGYQGLYGGLRQSQIHKKKGLTKEQKILDHMDSEELAANLFRATQTESKIKREQIQGEEKATIAHYEIGKKVRKTIQEIGGTMPEKLPAVENIKHAEKRVKEKTMKNLKSGV